MTWWSRFLVLRRRFPSRWYTDDVRKLLKCDDPEHQSRFHKSTEDYYNRVIEFYGRTAKFVSQARDDDAAGDSRHLVLTLFLYVVVPKALPGAGDGVILGIWKGRRMFLSCDGRAASRRWRRSF